MFGVLFFCPVCRKPAQIHCAPLCSDCWGALRPCPPLCTYCGGLCQPNHCEHPWENPKRIIRSFHSSYALTQSCYAVLKRWKLSGGRLLDRMILAPLKSLPLDLHYVVPIPQKLNRSWQLKRSPAFQVARYLSRHQKSLLLAELLKSNGDQKKRQAQKSLQERFESPVSFSHTKKLPRSFKPQAPTLLVDDFRTSGKTVETAALILHEMGFQNIHVYTLGYRPPPIREDEKERLRY